MTKWICDYFPLHRDPVLVCNGKSIWIATRDLDNDVWHNFDHYLALMSHTITCWRPLPKLPPDGFGGAK